MKSLKGLSRLILAGFLLALLFSGCSAAPIPPEVDLAESQVDELRAVGADLFTPERMTSHVAMLNEARLAFALESDRWKYLRKYDKVAESYKAVLANGQEIRTAIAEIKERRSSDFSSKIAAAREKVEVLFDLTTQMNEGRLARRNLTKAEIALDDAKRSLSANDFKTVELKIGEAERQFKYAQEALTPILCRYLDNGQVDRWRRLVDSAVAESARTGGLLLVVLKLDRKMIVYRDGKVVSTYPVGLGKNGLSDKAYRGDRATPEGRYRVLRKVPNSRYYKALYIDYPNEEDRQRFAALKKRGLIPKGRSIGGDVEIHGGGCESVTEGCVSMDNNSMDRIYNAAGPGTPVVIVGALATNGYLGAGCIAQRKK